MLRNHPTIRHIAGRAGWYFVTFLVAVTINFFLPRLGDANPVDTIMARASSNLDSKSAKEKEEGYLKEFGKGLPLASAAAETMGIERLEAHAGMRLFEALDGVIGAGRKDLYYEDVYSDLVAHGDLTAEAVEVGDLPWTEVDTVEDLERAKRLSFGADESV